MLFRSAILAVVAKGVNALKAINARIDAPKQQSPLVEYYHHFVPLLGWVMTADGHMDRRERAKIATICNTMGISPYERDRLLRRATSPQNFDVNAQTARYLELARAIDLATPDWQLLIAAVAVAGADGVVADGEAHVIREIGAAAGIDPEDVNGLLAQATVTPAEMDREQARQLLAVDEAASPATIEAAHKSLSEGLAQGHYGHLGQRLEAFVEARREILDRARALLSPATA